VSGAGRATWTHARERGTRIGIRIAVGFFRLVGRRWSALLGYPLLAYYFFTAPAARRASRDYLRRLWATPAGRAALGRPPGTWESFLHFRAFVASIFDRLAFWTGLHDRFEVIFHGRQHLLDAMTGGRGVILLGAHLGSFDVLRVLAGVHHVKVNVLMFTDNAERINAVFEQLDPTSRMHVIRLHAGEVGAAFEAKAALDRGEIVAVLADRVGPADGRRVGHAAFLGGRAAFPQGPHLLAALLGAPVFFAVALATGPARYEVFAEPFAPGGVVPRRERETVVEKRIQDFAARLEHYCGVAPYQWFNFYPYWDEPA
jgi:predicted LPLAT superfamily acyltransferase